MADLANPSDVDPGAGRLVDQPLYFLESPRTAMDVPAGKYGETNHSEINEGIRQALAQLDGSSRSAIALLTGLSVDQIDQYGGSAAT